VGHDLGSNQTRIDNFHEEMHKSNTIGPRWRQTLWWLTYGLRLKDNLRFEYLAFYEKTTRYKAQPVRPKKQLRMKTYDTMCVGWGWLGLVVGVGGGKANWRLRFAALILIRKKIRIENDGMNTGGVTLHLRTFPSLSSLSAVCGYKHRLSNSVAGNNALSSHILIYNAEPRKTVESYRLFGGWVGWVT